MVVLSSLFGAKLREGEECCQHMTFQLLKKKQDVKEGKYEGEIGCNVGEES